MIRTLFFATAAISFVTLPAFAAEQIMAFDRERLDDPAYVEVLYADIKATARDVCKKEVRGAAFYHNEMDYCVRRSIADAVEQISHPMMTAYAEGAPEIGAVAAR